MNYRKLFVGAALVATLLAGIGAGELHGQATEAARCDRRCPSIEDVVTRVVAAVVAAQEAEGGHVHELPGEIGVVCEQDPRVAEALGAIYQALERIADRPEPCCPAWEAAPSSSSSTPPWELSVGPLVRSDLDGFGGKLEASKGRWSWFLVATHGDEDAREASASYQSFEGYEEETWDWYSPPTPIVVDRELVVRTDEPDEDRLYVGTAYRWTLRRGR